MLNIDKNSDWFNILIAILAGMKDVNHEVIFYFINRPYTPTVGAVFADITMPTVMQDTLQLCWLNLHHSIIAIYSIIEDNLVIFKHLQSFDT